MIGLPGNAVADIAKPMKTLPRITFGVLLVSCVSIMAQERVSPAELADLSLEQLANVTVTSASRREERVIEAPASIFVLTAEDIRRSGATTLPELLRLAPNLQVVRGDASQYTVTARGNISGTANKMLVLIDGRTVYTPLFAGVFWDAQNVLFEDLERIEVISGPGSTLWGTNAVNGVINVTTKPAARTQGALVAAGIGDQQRGASVRAGGVLSRDGHYRVYAKYFDRDENRLASGASARDAADRWQVGFRTDWERASRSLTVQGDVYGADVGNLGGVRDLSGGNVLARWRRRDDAGSEVMLQAYFDRTEREHRGSFQEKRDTFDLEFNHMLRNFRGHELVWGAGYRGSRDATANTPTLGFMPASRTQTLGSVFAQDEIALGPKSRATLGVRAEHNNYTGLEWLPNLRFAHAFSPSHLAWAALTRTVRSPSRIDRDLVLPGMPPFTLVNNDTFKSEIANVAEVGYRAQLAPRVSASLTAFHHRFRDLRTQEALGPALVLANSGEGNLSGVEAWGDYAVGRTWRLVLGFVTLNESYRVKPGRVDVSRATLGNDPKRTASLRSLWNVTRNHELDVMVRHVGDLPNPFVPAYTVVDARAGWRFARDLELSLVVGNAFDRRHAETGAPAVRAEFGRNVFLKLTWKPS